MSMHFFHSVETWRHFNLLFVSMQVKIVWAIWGTNWPWIENGNSSMIRIVRMFSFDFDPSISTNFAWHCEVSYTLLLQAMSSMIHNDESFDIL